jgi:hypothetical protein
MHKKILKSVVGGNLLLLVKSDKNVESQLQDIWNEAASKPSIYYQQFVCIDCESLTPSELITMLDAIGIYVSGTDH